ncbi:S-layer homology domain-containing protein [Aneurinibacillus terranovensis]|uniref:S-layer homology domain-containing protein n=1 Tax=Aneurinibacillus terranovensis TaxID=278991 RepID=UPI0003F6378E|nr:S-layer homology domain-containing protein [Aneurinibacillus terranovensis]
MQRFKRSCVPLTLAGFLALTGVATPLVVKADTTTTTSVNFSDVAQTHWAYPQIVKMELRNVVAGYQDGTFRPEDKVTQLQALVMAMRNMGLTDQAANDKNTANLPYVVADWGKGYVALAIEKGLIKPSEQRFAPDQPATRQWVAQLMVRMIGKESDVGKTTGNNASFTDSNSISDWAKGYVQVAVNDGLISGYQAANGYSFKPTQAVTRAEMVALLSRGEKYLDIESATTHVGSLQTMSDSSITIKSSKNDMQYTYTINDQTVFYSNGKSISKDTIQPASQLLVIGSNGQASYVEVEDSAPQNKVINGTVEKVYPEVKSMVLKDAQGKLATYQLDDNAVFSSSDGSVTGIGQLTSGDGVQITINPSGNIIQVAKTTDSANKNLQGTVYDIDDAAKLITIKTADGKIAAYQYNNDTYVDYKGKRFPTVGDLQQGDPVKLQVVQGVVTSIALQQDQTAPSNTGTVKTIIPDQQFIAIQGDNDNQIHAYQVAADVKITIGNVTNAALSDIIVGDKAQITTDGNTITAIVVKDRTVDDKSGMVSGVVFAVDTTNHILSLKNNNGDLKAYEVNTNASYIIDGVTNPALSDLKKDMNVSIQLDQDNKVIYVNADNRVKGTVLRINTDDHLLTVKLDSGETKVYVMDNNVNVTIHNLSGENVNDLRINDTVSMQVSGAKITEIDVQRPYIYYVTNVSNAANQLTGQDDQGNIRYFNTDGSVTLTVPGVLYPRVSDVKVGDVIEATFLGDTLKSITVVPSVLGQITAIDTVNSKFTVQDANGVTTEVPFVTGSLVKTTDQQYTTLSALHVGDRVQVAGASTGGKTINVMKRIDAIFTSLDPAGDRVYTTTSSYYLPDSLFNRQPAITTFLHGLNKNDKISIYMFNNQVYDIAKTN